MDRHNDCNNNNNRNHNNNNSATMEDATMSDEPTDPRTFVLEMRRRAITRKSLLRPAPNSQSQPPEAPSPSLEHLIRTTRALIATNEEIWARCQPHYCGRVVGEERTHPEAPHDEEKGAWLLFVRVAACTVDVTTYGTHVKDTVMMKTALEMTKHEFYLPMVFPSKLRRLVPVPRVGQDDAVPNLRDLIHRAMLLSDDVMAIFLMEYKHYLENLQVALGVIDAWLLEATKSEQYLKNNFGVSTNPGQQEFQAFKNQHLTVDPIYSGSCSRCGKKRHKHTLTRSWLRCSDGSSSDPPIDEQQLPRAYFPLTAETNLLVCKFRGYVNIRFFIDEPRERKRLTKMMEFAASFNPSSTDDDEDHDGNDDVDQST